MRHHWDPDQQPSFTVSEKLKVKQDPDFFFKTGDNKFKLLTFVDFPGKEHAWLLAEY